MNYTPAKTPTPDYLLHRKSELYRILDAICHDLEITEAQYEAAKANYEAVSAWLSASDDPVLKYLDLYVHGSTGLGTTVKPLGRDEFDVDLICLVLSFSIQRSPSPS